MIPLSFVTLLVPIKNDFICTPIAPPAATADSYEIKPALWNLVMKDKFSGIGEDFASHLNNLIYVT